MNTYLLAGSVLGMAVSSALHGGSGWCSAALLVSDRETVVIDPGSPGYRPQWDGWLAAAGRDRRDVTRVFLTHAHWDHLGATSWFTNASVHISREEFEWASVRAADDPYLHPGLLQAIGDESTLNFMDDGEAVADVQAVSTPGHTPGHLSYLVPTLDGSLLVVGDAVKTVHELRSGDFAMTLDAKASEKSLSRIRAMAEAGTELMLGHDGIYAYTATGVRPVTRR